ncbi:MAG: glycosyltransferase family 4 protein, partial [candidate division Zixibacteria bacterium]|nr:glycosyltransferase family 4 protein [candidate division Zixibacteria bacterium]
MPSTVAYFTSRISGVPFSFTAHAKDIFVYEPSETLLQEKCERSSFVITVTHYNKSYFHQILPEINHDKIRVLHNGVNLERFSYNDQRNRKDNLILAIGRLVPKKGFHTLLEACSELRRRGRDFECVIIGDGQEREKLQTQLSELDLNGFVSLVGSKTSDEVKALMDEATVVCLPCCVATDNNQDALPTVLLEALACGVPSVSTNVSGIPEIIESGKEGFLVDPETPQDIADRLEQILSDKELRERFGRNGRAKAESFFNLEKNVGELLRLFKSAQNPELLNVQSSELSASESARKKSDVRS